MFTCTYVSPLQRYKCVHSQVECCHTCFLGIWEVEKCPEMDLDGEQSHSQPVRVREAPAGRRAVGILHLQKQRRALLLTLPHVHFH